VSAVSPADDIPPESTGADMRYVPEIQRRDGKVFLVDGRGETLVNDAWFQLSADGRSMELVVVPLGYAERFECDVGLIHHFAGDGGKEER
jgi:hypothetical protein